MSFALQEYAWLLLLVPIAGMLGFYRAKVHQRRIERLIDSALLSEVCESPERIRRKLLRSTLILAITTLLLVSALLRPQWGFEWKESRHRGGDIVLAVDVSESMLAADAPPNRLERAKRKIVDLVRMLRGDRVALVAFAGVAFIESPLTLDYGAFSQYLSLLSPDLIPIKGSNIEVALKKSLEALGVKDGTETIERGAAIILLTDGEELDGDFTRIGELAKANGVRIYVLGMGTAEGAPIPMPTGGYKKDKNGRVVITRLRSDILEQIALSSGGTYVQSISSSKDIETIYNESMRQGLSETEQTMGSTKRWHEYYQLPLAIALLLIVIVHWGRFLRSSGRGSVAALVAALLLSASPVRAESAEQLGADARLDFEKGDFAAAEKKFEEARNLAADDPRFALGLGATRYRLGNYDNAQASFAEAASAAIDPQTKASALYNLGNSLVQSNRYKEAITAYEHSLKFVPDDQETKDNLAYAKKKLEEQKQNDDKDDEQEQKQDQKNNNRDEQQSSSSSSSKDQEEQQQQDSNQSSSSSSSSDESHGQDQSQEQSSSSSSDSGEQSSPQPSDENQDQSSSAQPESGQESSQKEDENGRESESPRPAEGQNDTPAPKQDKGEVLLDSVQEKQDARNRYRAQQAIRQLKAEKRKLPEKDW